MSDGLLTEEEVKSYLKVDSGALGQLLRRGKLTAYKVGGSFVRYRKDEVVALRSGRKYRLPDEIGRSGFDRARDFINFYGVYILLSILAVLLAVYFLQS